MVPICLKKHTNDYLDENRIKVKNFHIDCIFHTFINIYC